MVHFKNLNIRYAPIHKAIQVVKHFTMPTIIPGMKITIKRTIKNVSSIVLIKPLPLYNL